MQYFDQDLEYRCGFCTHCKMKWYDEYKWTKAEPYMMNIINYLCIIMNSNFNMSLNKHVVFTYSHISYTLSYFTYTVPFHTLHTPSYYTYTCTFHIHWHISHTLSYFTYANIHCHIIFHINIHTLSYFTYTTLHCHISHTLSYFTYTNIHRHISHTLT